MENLISFMWEFTGSWNQKVVVEIKLILHHEI